MSERKLNAMRNGRDGLDRQGRQDGRKEKFTPGPWRTEEDGLIDKMVVGGNYDLIIDLTHKDGKRNEADSNLIAVAPEMYARHSPKRV